MLSVLGAQDLIHRQRHAAHCLQRVQQFLDGRFAELAGKRNAPSGRSPPTSSRSAPLEPSASLFSVGSPLIRNFEPRGDFAAASAPALLRSSPTTNSSARLVWPASSKFAHGEDHGRDDALGIASAASPDVLVVFARREERRHGVHVRGERDRWLAPPGENVVAPAARRGSARHGRHTARPSPTGGRRARRPSALRSR